MRTTALLAALIAANAGCSERPVTEIVVVSDTDLVVPVQVDEIAITIEPPSGLATERRARLDGEGAIALPATLGVVHRGGPLGPVRVTATALHGAEVVVTREAVLEFIQDRTVTLLLPLEGACRGVACDDGETCASGACRPVEVTRDELLPWDGTTPRLEAGVPCTTELCNRFDDDCDGTVDEGFDLTSDVEHCGACGHACAAHPGGMPACVDGECGIERNSGLGDCDGDLRNGCEVALNTLTTCGSCDTPCDVPHGTPTCFTGSCEPLSCAPGWGDCLAGADGCESPLDTPEHCGSCATRCAPANATPSCAGGVCAIASCDPGWADCDRSADDGCERSVTTVDDCGACGAACGAVDHGTPACLAGRCGVGSCEPGWDDCNGATSDGCETPLDTVTDCGACGVACSLPHASESCTTGRCAIDTCDPGWSDCDGVTSNGCETSLESASDCGACDNACSGATPLCGPAPGGGRSCQSICQPTEVLCGASCVDPSTSLAHCGGCGRACAPAHARGACTAGTCEIAACDAEFGDCNGTPSDGCETSLRLPSTCGSCTASCPALDHATSTCASGTCALAGCEPLWGDCDGVESNGCEQSLEEVTSCGACGVTCVVDNGGGALPTCAGGVCAVTCTRADRADCNRLVTDGCETRLQSDPRNCGSCGRACAMGEVCRNGRCER